MLKLPHWSLTNKFPTLYDMDSATVIEQTAKVYGAMNELIENYNKFVDKCNAEIETFEASTVKDNKVFAIALRQEFQDFIDAIELKIMSQDSDIKESVEYMKNNLANSINDILEEMKANEGFSQEVKNVFGEMTNKLNVLTSRVDTLSSLPNGATTADAEVADARVGYDGTKYTSMGEAVRTQITKVVKGLNDTNDTLKHTELLTSLRDFVKRGNLAKSKSYTANNSDGTTRNFLVNSTDNARVILNGTFNAIKVSAPLTNTMTLEANKKYTVYMTTDCDVDFRIFLYGENGVTYQENGTNKSFKPTSEPFSVIEPTTTGNYYFGLYLNFDETFINESIYLYIVEGEHTLDELFFLYNKDEIMGILVNLDNRLNLSKVNNLPKFKNNLTVNPNGTFTMTSKIDDTLGVLYGSFLNNTFTPFTEYFTVEANKEYTIFTSSNLTTSVNILFADENNNYINNGGVNISACPNGLSFVKFPIGGKIRAGIYSYVEQQIATEMTLNVIEGKLAMPDLQKYLSVKDFKHITKNMMDTTFYKEDVLNKNLLTMTSNFVVDGKAEPSIIEKSVTKLNGKIHNLRLSNEFEVKAGTQYTVLAVDSHKDVNYSIFFENVETGVALQTNGVNKGFNVTNNTSFDIFTPDNDATVKAFIYNSSNDTVKDHYLRVVVLEGAYAYNDLIETPYVENNHFNVEKYNVPLLKLFGSTAGMSKDNKVTLKYEFGEHTGSCTIKWQGSSSLAHPKKNYTITFDSAFEAKQGWGAQKKYCLKANYIDFSHARNVVSAKLWGQIVKSRAVQNEKLIKLPNGGAIDGFPCVVIINGLYQGLYTFNIPKDKWMLNMGNGDSEFIVSAEAHSMPTAFKSTFTLEDFENETYFSLEEKSDTLENATIVSAINALTNACINGGENFRETVSEFMDIESAIDYYIFVCLICGGDMTNKNYLLSSYDGVKMFFTAYDMDSTFGNVWDGKSYNEPTHTPMLINYANMNRLMKLIYEYDKETLKTRYAELRNTVLSEDNVYYTFVNFIKDIPKALFDEEVKIWCGIPSTATNNLEQIMNFYRMRCKAIDAEIDAL